MTTRKNHLYIICWLEWDNEMEIGYLPFSRIPEKSILRNAIFDDNEYLRTDGSGIKGIYDKKVLANEHLKLERKWRTRANLWIHKIENPGFKRKNK